MQSTSPSFQISPFHQDPLIEYLPSLGSSMSTKKRISGANVSAARSQSQRPASYPESSSRRAPEFVKNSITPLSLRPANGCPSCGQWLAERHEYIINRHTPP
ncbi:unnamed protein product, partial [Ectocarpus sp. 13 AM-2016]